MSDKVHILDPLHDHIWSLGMLPVSG